MRQQMDKNRKKVLWCRFFAVITCFAMMVTVFSAVTVQAASVKALTLKYKGKTIAVYDCAVDEDSAWDKCKQISYAKIKKAFGKPDKIASKPSESGTVKSYQYKADGFFFGVADDDSIENEKNHPWDYIKIEITSKKAALNGVKVGMSYDTVLKKLKNKYGKGRISVQKNKKQIILSILCSGSDDDFGMPVGYTFKNGKVSKISFFGI